jgi:hypothetical protein
MGQEIREKSGEFDPMGQGITRILDPMGQNKANWGSGDKFTFRAGKQKIDDFFLPTRNQEFPKRTPSDKRAICH